MAAQIHFTILILLFSTLHALFLPPINSSYHSQTLTLNSSPLLHQILKSIAAKGRWHSNSEIRILQSDPIGLSFGNSRKYEFNVRFGKTVLVLKFEGEVDLWRKSEKEWVGFEELNGFNDELEARVSDLEMVGPLDLRVDSHMELILPSSNVRYGGLKHILVGDGITIRVNSAQEVTLFHPHDIGLSSHNSSVKSNQGIIQFWTLPSCAPLLSVQVVGPASIAAIHSRNSELHVKYIFHSDDTIELLSDKCSNIGYFKRAPSWIFSSLNSKLVLLEKTLKNFVGNVILQSGHSQLLKAKVTSLNLVKLRLEVERDITENDRIWSRVAEWRTKPVVERAWFEIVARVEKGEWKLLLVRKLTRPILAVESNSWSNLMSNISFTQLPSIVLPPEALTLDVNW